MSFTYERIDKNNVALLVVDHQEGLFQIARDRTTQEMKSAILAHAELAKVFNLPTVLTTSAETGEQSARPSERRELKIDGRVLAMSRTKRASAQGDH